VILLVYTTSKPSGRGPKRRYEAVRLLGLQVRILPGAWVPVSYECCVLSGRGLCIWPILHTYIQRVFCHSPQATTGQYLKMSPKHLLPFPTYSTFTDFIFHLKLCNIYGQFPVLIIYASNKSNESNRHKNLKKPVKNEDRYPSRRFYPLGLNYKSLSKGFVVRHAD